MSEENKNRSCSCDGCGCLVIIILIILLTGHRIVVSFGDKEYKFGLKTEKVEHADKTREQETLSLQLEGDTCKYFGEGQEPL